MARSDAAGSGAHHLYVRTDSTGDVAQACFPLSPTYRLVISALRLGATSAAEDVARTTGVARSRLTAMFEAMQAQGLVVTVAFANRRYASITDLGLANPGYDKAAPKAPPADLIKDFGAERLTVLQVLTVAGPLPTRQISDALTAHLADPPKRPSALLGRLADAGLIEHEAADNGHGCYKIAPKGLAVLAELHGSIPASAEIERAIRRARASRVTPHRRKG